MEKRSRRLTLYLSSCIYFLYWKLSFCVAQDKTINLDCLDLVLVAGTSGNINTHSKVIKYVLKFC